MKEEDLDKLFYHILRNWDKGDNSFTYRGLDFFELTQFYLWDKIGRALRRKYFPERATEQIPSSGKPKTSSPGDHVSPVDSAYSGDPHQKRIMVPVRPAILNPIIEALREKPRIQVIPTGFDWEAYKSHSMEDLPNEDRDFINGFISNLVAGLDAFEIKLAQSDLRSLEDEMAMIIASLPAMHEEFEQIQPDLVLLHVDNHPPYQVYAQIAQNRNIPVMMFQHGLDCEHYILDNAYADYIAVWGESRKKRYESFSEHPAVIRVTGNPHFENYSLAENHKQHDLIWVTRPHSSIKCYSPYRFPTEASDIMEALLRFMEANPERELIVRPHPFADVELLKSLANNSPSADRITFDRDSSIRDLIGGATLVLSEDSTVALEAMLLGKPLVHVHFANNKPVLKIEEYAAGYLAKNDSELNSLLVQQVKDPHTFNEDLREGQKRFIKDHAGPQDGKSLERITDFVAQAIKTNMKKIGFISLNDHVPWGGSEVFWSDLAEHLIDDGNYKVAIAPKFWEDSPDRVKELLEKGAVDMRRKPVKKLRLKQRLANKLLPPSLKFRPRRKHADVVRDFRPDLMVISLGDHNRGQEWMKICRKYSIPYILIVQLVKDAHFPPDSSKTYADLKEGYRCAERVLVPSHDNLHILQKQFALKLENAEIINNPVRKIENQPSYPEGEPHQVAMVASLNMNHKGQDILLDCLRQDKWQERPIHFNLYGKGAHENIIRNLIDLYGIKNVSLCGYADLEEIWSKNQILCMPSRMEGLSLAFLEALQCERSAIVTRVGDTERFIEDNVNGFLIGAPQTDMLDEALERAWTRRSEWRTMGKKANIKLQELIQEDPVSVVARKIDSYISF